MHVLVLVLQLLLLVHLQGTNGVPLLKCRRRACMACKRGAVAEGEAADWCGYGEEEGKR